MTAALLMPVRCDVTAAGTSAVRGWGRAQPAQRGRTLCGAAVCVHGQGARYVVHGDALRLANLYGVLRLHKGELRRVVDDVHLCTAERRVSAGWDKRDTETRTALVRVTGKSLPPCTPVLKRRYTGLSVMAIICATARRQPAPGKLTGPGQRHAQRAAGSGPRPAAASPWSTSQ